MNPTDKIPEMNDVVSIEMMNFAEFLQERIPDKPQIRPIITFAFNTTKYNKNLISFSGISILVVFFLVYSGIIALSRLGWITATQIQFYTV